MTARQVTRAPGYQAIADADRETLTPDRHGVPPRPRSAAASMQRSSGRHHHAPDPTDDPAARTQCVRPLVSVDLERPRGRHPHGRFCLPAASRRAIASATREWPARRAADERLSAIAIACSPSMTPALQEQRSHHVDAHRAVARFCCRTKPATPARPCPARPIGREHPPIAGSRADVSSVRLWACMGGFTWPQFEFGQYEGSCRFSRATCSVVNAVLRDEAMQANELLARVPPAGPNEHAPLDRVTA